jgi:hypothetical protein
MPDQLGRGRTPGRETRGSSTDARPSRHPGRQHRIGRDGTVVNVINDGNHYRYGVYVDGLQPNSYGVMQTDGNFVICSPRPVAEWATNTPAIRVHIYGLQATGGLSGSI